MIINSLIHLYIPQLDYVSNFHIGETLTALQKATLTPGGSEAMVYSTIMGSIGVLLPLLTKDEVCVGDGDVWGAGVGVDSNNSSMNKR